MNKHNFQEPTRHEVNQKALLEAMPEIVLLITNGGHIEYMNTAASTFFFGSDRQLTKEKLQAELQPAVSIALDRKGKKLHRCTLNDQLFDFFLAPFSGYKGDNLFWLMLKPVANGSKQYVSKEEVSSEEAIIGSSDQIRTLKETVSKIANSDATVLLEGESGTGKELVANLLRTLSDRTNKPFLAINCSSISEDLLESELFGHEKGSFTGANSSKIGKFEAVDGGTLFLDEVGEISPRMQAVLLRVLQYGEIIRVGSTKPIKVDVRIVAATNRDLKNEVDMGRFRLDLFYRLSVINIHVPPLRSRGDDIPELARHFVGKYSRVYNRKVNRISKDAEEHLCSYFWPGNVRELENVIQRAVLMVQGSEISLEDLRFDLVQEAEKSNSENFSELVKSFNGTPLRGMVSLFEKEVIKVKLTKFNGNVTKTASALSVCKAGLYEKMRKYEINAKNHRIKKES